MQLFYHFWDHLRWLTQHRPSLCCCSPEWSFIRLFHPHSWHWVLDSGSGMHSSDVHQRNEKHPSACVIFSQFSGHFITRWLVLIAKSFLYSLDGHLKHRTVRTKPEQSLFWTWLSQTKHFHFHPSLSPSLWRPYLLSHLFHMICVEHLVVRVRRPVPAVLGVA